MSPLLEVTDLHKHYPVASGQLRRRPRLAVRAVDGVSLTIQRGESLGLVGESGCGKTTLAECVLRLQEPTSGSITFEDRDLLNLSRTDLRTTRGRMQMIFQNALGAMNPRMTVEEIITEPLVVHRVGDRDDRRRRVLELLGAVGLDAGHLKRYPHEFSGGQQQRIVIARAIALDPSLVVCDEPVSALDVSIRAQVINLLSSLQRDRQLTYLFIAHDLGVVRHLCSSVAVMYLGRVVEYGPTSAVYRSPRHPYTVSLLSAVPVPDPDLQAARRRIVLEGDPPSPTDPPSGCRFRTRCWKAQELCAVADPSLDDVGGGQLAACHFPEPAQPVAGGERTESRN